MRSGGEGQGEEEHAILVAIAGTTFLVPSHPVQVTAAHLKIGKS